MGYSRKLTSEGFLHFVQPFQDQLPTKPQDLPLSLKLSIEHADQCAYYWREFLNNTNIKQFYRVSVKRIHTEPQFAYVVITRKIPKSQIAPLIEVGRGDPTKPYHKSDTDIGRVAASLKIVQDTFANEGEIKVDPDLKSSLEQFYTEGHAEDEERIHKQLTTNKLAGAHIFEKSKDDYLKKYLTKSDDIPEDACDLDDDEDKLFESADGDGPQNTE